MKHRNAWILIMAAAAVAIAAALFQPKTAPSKEITPVRAGDRGGIVIVDGAALIDVNSAGAELLRELPGVGEVMAGAIIEGRPYADIEDMRRVKGIGEAMTGSLRDRVAFGE